MSRPTRHPKFRVDEDALQIYAADVLRTFGVPGLLWWHTPNGGYRHIAVAKLLKSMGTKAGVPDLACIVPCPCMPNYNLGFVEIKLGKKGRLNEDQIEFEKACKGLRIPYVVARTPDEIDNALRQLGAINKPVTQPAEKPVCVVQDGSGHKVKRGRSRPTSKRRMAA